MLMICSLFLSQLITSNFSSVVIRIFFTWIALGDVDLHCHSFWQQKPRLLKEELNQPHITNVINPHVTDGVTVTSLSVSLQHKTVAATPYLCQIV
jgi:hypothetical protein